MGKLLLGFWLLALSMVSTAQAQEREWVNVHSFAVYADVLGPNEAACGFPNADQLQLAVEDHGRGMGLSYDPMAPHFVHIELMAMPLEEVDLCYGMVRLSLNQAATHEGEPSRMELTYVTTLLHAPRAEFRDYVMSGFSGLIDKLAEDYRQHREGS